MYPQTPKNPILSRFSPSLERLVTVREPSRSSAPDNNTFYQFVKIFFI